MRGTRSAPRRSKRPTMESPSRSRMCVRSNQGAVCFGPDVEFDASCIGCCAQELTSLQLAMMWIVWCGEVWGGVVADRRRTMITGHCWEAGSCRRWCRSGLMLAKALKVSLSRNAYQDKVLATLPRHQLFLGGGYLLLLISFRSYLVF